MQLFFDSVMNRFADSKKLGDKTFEQLNDAEMHMQPNEASNSIAIIIQHMHGNMLSRWTNFLSEDGEKDWRKRDEEFETQQRSKIELLQLWEDGWQVLFNTLNSLNGEDLEKTITIRHEPHHVIDAIVRQVAHYSYHVGQIVLLGKWIRSEEWRTLSIPKKGSKEFNEKMRGGRH
ncbi:MAG TPA: DUF1572 family protein [Chitinophagaceae bacterium]|jgi:hypothetical protein|nr:DUF1572 family protein [Chitinophagaceae bacterium]